MNLLPIEKAKLILAKSGQRKDEIITLMNKEIEKQASIGLKWASIPSGLSPVEKDWLLAEATIHGYTVKHEAGQLMF